MRKTRSVFGVLGALLPVLYCGGLIYYFIDNSGSLKAANDIGLGPTLGGLAIVGLLFCIPLIWKVMRIFARPRSPGSGEAGGASGPAAKNEGGFDPDAAIARYLASRPSEAMAGVSPTSRPPTGGSPSKPSGFGRRSR